MPDRVGYLGLGSNVGERKDNLARALKLLPEHGVEVAVSYTHLTLPTILLV